MVSSVVRSPARTVALLVAALSPAWIGCETADARRGVAAGAADRRAAARDNPVELGRVHWLRDFSKARKLATSRGEPLLVLFDEVPGCSTVRGFGRRVLSQPQIVKAIGEHFVGVAIYNNAGGKDRRVLRAFSEPAWNNPVVRIIDAKRRALAPRFAGPYTVRAFAETLVTALRRARRPVPGYLARLAGHRAPRARVTLAMHCFWAGEAKLGRIEAVETTAAGFLAGREVVEVTYDPGRLSLEALVRKARALGVASRVFVHQRSQLKAARAGAGRVPVQLTRKRMRPSPTDDKYYLRRSRWASVSMTPEQATRANAAIAAGRAPSNALSPGHARPSAR